MPSIRRSLILYFLLLMGLTLGVVGLFVRHEVASALESRAAADATRINADARRRLDDSKQQFDRELFLEARTLLREFGRNYFSQPEPTRLNLYLLPLGFSQSALSREIATALYRQPRLAPWRDSALGLLHGVSHGEDPQRRTYFAGEHFDGAVFQFNIVRNDTSTVVTPPGQAPFVPRNLEREPGSGSVQFDDLELSGHGTVRMITWWFNGLGGGPRNPRPSGPPPERPPGPQSERNGVLVFGRDRAKHDEAIATIAAERDAHLARLPVNVANDLRNASGTLALVAAGFLLLLPVGGWLLVGRGLRPLNTLTTAVSRVSERDFRLLVSASQLSTELAPIHDRLTRTLDALRRAFEREKEAVGDISHELRTPIAALQTTIDVALRKPRDAEFYKGTLTDCRNITKQLGRLVDRILTLATLDAGEPPSWTPVDVADLAADCAALIRPLAEGHGLSLAVELDPTARSTTDPDKLREVMLNLLHNAVEYNRPGGEVRLTVASVADGVSVSVADTGIGMTPEVRAKIFERFYRADPSRHATGLHAGLGLAIVKEYVERLRGRIAVTSSPGEGSRFEVAIPAIAG